jgi:hypothetical protein
VLRRRGRAAEPTAEPYGLLVVAGGEDVLVSAPPLEAAPRLVARWGQYRC